MSEATLRVGPSDVDQEYARRALEAGPGNLETFSLQANARGTRSALALAASGGRLGWSDLRKTLSIAAKTQGVSVRNEMLDHRPLLALARIEANQARSGEETECAVLLFKSALSLAGSNAFSRADRLMFTEALADLGHARDLERYLRLLRVERYDRNQAPLLRANALLKQSGVPVGPDSTAWLDLVNEKYRFDGIETIGIAPGLGSPFDRILAGPAERVVGGPLVTVIVPTYNSGPRIDTALRSITHQTWQNLEILVMDDASPEENDRYLTRWAERDPRVRVHKMEQNGGTYASRNFALEHLANGDLVTVHDDDDWSHPRKIQVQVEHLIANPNCVANMSLLSRATDSLRFTRINNNPVFAQRNYSSLMFWRERVIGQVGYWDRANRSADAEFIDRLGAAYGSPVATAGRCVLSFLRVREDSLTSGEISRGYIDSQRLWYQHAYRDWHSKSRGSSDLKVSAQGTSVDMFATPSNMRGSRLAARSDSVDFLYVTDFRFPGGNTSLAVNEIRTMAEAGRRVALMHFASPVLGSRATVDPRFLELAKLPTVSIVARDDRVRARATIVRHPSVMQFAPRSRSGVDTDRLVLIVNHPPYTGNGGGSIYHLPEAIANTEAIFGRNLVVAPESGLIREMIGSQVSDERLTTTNWYGVVSSSFEARTPKGRVPLRIGRHSRDHALKWPGTADELLAAYPDRSDIEIHVLGGAKFAKSLVSPLPSNWRIHSFGSVEPTAFLRTVNFWVYHHHPDWTESFGMAIAEAMASGLVVLLPPYMRSTFGEGAIYTLPDGVESTIRRIASDPIEYRSQSQTAVEFARANFSSDVLEARLASLLGE